MNLEERVERLENFIGDIDEIRLYANSLQEVIDKYLAPLYIESGSGKTMLVDGYLGDLENIPHNVIFKIRASHDLVMNPGDEQALIRFKRGTDYTEYTLRKMVDGALVPLESSNYTAGEVYDIYINSQDVAIITSNDTGVRALSEIAALTVRFNEAVLRLDGEIDAAEAAAKAYTDEKSTASNTRIQSLETFLAPIQKSGSGSSSNYTFPNKIIAKDVEAQNLKVTSTVTLTGVTGFQLPSGTTISDPSANLGLANKQWVTTQINNAITDYHSQKHITGTSDAATALNGKPNGTFYYKLSQ